MRNPATRFVFELFLWNVANILCVALPTAATYFIGTAILGWGPAYLSFYLTSALLVTLTWGSWAGRVWTRNRAIRAGMLATTLIPGAITMAIGGIGLWVGFGAWYLWAGIIGAGVGTIAAAIGLARYFRPDNVEPRVTQYLLGLFVYPVVTTAAAFAVASLWYNYVTNPASGDWRDIVSIATVYVTVLASVLISTVIPAALSSGLRKLSGDVLPR